MDNELDGRLRRLETAMEAQRKILDGHTAQMEKTQAMLGALVTLVMRSEPEGPPLHELLAQLIGAVARGNSFAKQTLAAIERLSQDNRGD